MRLYVEHHGALFEAVEDIEEYDLSKLAAKSMVCHDIRRAIEYAKNESAPDGEACVYDDFGVSDADLPAVEKPADAKGGV